MCPIKRTVIQFAKKYASDDYVAHFGKTVKINLQFKNIKMVVYGRYYVI